MMMMMMIYSVFLLITAFNAFVFAHAIPQYSDDLDDTGNPVPEPENSDDAATVVTQGLSASNSISNSKNSKDLSYDIARPDCSPTASDQLLNDGSSNNQLSSIFPRKISGEACPVRGFRGKPPEVPQTPGKPGLAPSGNQPGRATQEERQKCEKYEQFGMDIHLSCAGPEAIWNDDLIVAHCLPDYHPTLPARGPLEAADIVAQFCCHTYFSEDLPYAGYICVKITPEVQLTFLSEMEWERYLDGFRQTPSS